MKNDTHELPIDKNTIVKEKKSRDIFVAPCTTLRSEHPTSESDKLLHDIGNYIEIHNILKLDDAKKYDLLTNPWNPDKTYNFKDDLGENQKRCFRLEWLYQYPWLAYSKKLKGALCVHCVLFRPSIKRGVQGAFINKVFIKYKDLYDSAKKHSQTEWHKEAIIKSKLFSDVITHKKKSIDLQLNDANNELIRKNREKLRPIISSIVFCGTHDLALRGKQLDSGNFRDLLKFRVEAGSILEEHFKTCTGKTKYTSHEIQNELLIIFVGFSYVRTLLKKLITKTPLHFHCLRMKLQIFQESSSCQ